LYALPELSGSVLRLRKRAQSDALRITRRHAMNFDTENTFDLNDIVDHLEDHAAPSDDADYAALFADVERPHFPGLRATFTGVQS
jgi:hypothetical protein